MTAEIRPRRLAAAGSLAHTVLGGEGPISLPRVSALDPSALPPPREVRLGPEAFGSSGPETRRRLEAVLRGEGYFVSTGHQPVLLLGPLYIVYKVLTAISLAARLERTLGRPVVPLVWVAADDHDWAEVGRATLLDRSDEPHELALPVPEGAGRRSVGSCLIDQDLLRPIADVSEIVPASEFAPHYLESIRNAYAEGRTLSEAFVGLLREVLGDRGYVWIDSARPRIRRAAAPFYRRLLDGWEGALEAQAAGARALTEAGFEAPIAAVQGALPLFFDGGEGRRRIRPGAEESLRRWRERLETEPEGFSPNVASRPVLESYLLPVAATALGPGEIAYWSQLRPLFDSLDVRMPLIQPRAAWTLIEPRVRRTLDRAEISPQDLAAGAEPVVARLTREARPETVNRALRRFREEAEARLAEVEQAVADKLPGLRGTAGKTRKNVLKAADDLSRQVDRLTRQRLDVRIGQVRRAAASLFPGRRPQERVLSPFPFLCRYGPELIDRLAHETDEWVAASLADAGTDG
ncbi:bacillithiol biosynthesis cysteine-adding enzyme BshC [Candidatus Palauibacter sp.]|uniref:bacillithiol biosynthesis cysteine-adding enzyme BshC n=1 Tax=Candidatus Palauibacter sp. TaxID=3101350 RepID=UPI003AF2A8D0